MSFLTYMNVFNTSLNNDIYVDNVLCISGSSCSPISCIDPSETSRSSRTLYIPGGGGVQGLAVVVDLHRHLTGVKRLATPPIMTEKDNSLFDTLDTNRRSFMQKGALATGALALGASAGCLSAGQDSPEDETAIEGDYVLMLYPDAVENTEGTVISDEIDWLPWEDDVDDDYDDDVDDDDALVDDDADDADDALADDDADDADDALADDEDDDIDDDEDDYTAYLVDMDFSASHVALVFVPGDVEVERDDAIHFGEIEELLHGPDDPIEPNDVDDDNAVDDEDDDLDDDLEDDEDDDVAMNAEIGRDQAVLVKLSLEEPDEIDDDVDDDVDDDDDLIDDDDTDDDVDDADDDDGLFDDDDDDDDVDDADDADDDDGIL